MAIESKNLLVAVKAYARANPLPLDASEVYDSLQEAQTYAKAANAYAGQTIKVKNESGKYDTYVLSGEAGNYTLDKVGVDASAVKNYVQIVTELPGTGQEQGVIYVNTTDSKGYIWDGSEFQVIFEDVTDEDGNGLAEQLETIEQKFDEYAPLAGATFTGTVTLAADPTGDLDAATKQYVDRLVGGINDFTVGIVDSSNPLPTENYEVGQTFRVAEAGTYAGVQCEVGDLIIVISDYAESAKDSDFLVVQANVDGAVTGPDASTDANVVVFDGITGKKIKDSTVTLASLQDAIAKAHEHANKSILDTYTKTEEELLAAAGSATDEKLSEIQEELAGKADASDLSNYYTKSDVDEKLTVINENLNTKVTADQVDQKITEKVGDIPEGTTVKEYVDTAIGSGGSDVASQILQAKNEAIQTSKEYTNTALTIIEF